MKNLLMCLALLISLSAMTISALAEPTGIDLDLTTLSSTVVYSQVYHMTMRPGVYTGQRIKIKGDFIHFQDPATRQDYFAALIADATACCAQGIEFVWKGEHTYPEDYPPIDTEITVTGIFGTYEENGFTYIQLTDAEVTWEN